MISAVALFLLFPGGVVLGGTHGSTHLNPRLVIINWGFWVKLSNRKFSMLDNMKYFLSDKNPIGFSKDMV